MGYIVGLGDRHIQNVLIDEQTAELVHIDLGKDCSTGCRDKRVCFLFTLEQDIMDCHRSFLPRPIHLTVSIYLSFFVSLCLYLGRGCF